MNIINKAIFLTSLRTKQSGFTLIELLIVIGILGILAVALIVSLDPLEQTRRANDVARRTLASDFLNSLNRYYTQRLYQSFCTTSTCAAFRNGLNTTTATALSSLGGAASVNTELNNVGEAKTATSFSGNAQAANVYVTLTGATTAATAIICWSPQSKSQYSDASVNKYSQIGVVGGTGCTTAGTSTCYSCVFQ